MSFWHENRYAPIPYTDIKLQNNATENSSVENMPSWETEEKQMENKRWKVNEGFAQRQWEWKNSESPVAFETFIMFALLCQRVI